MAGRYIDEGELVVGGSPTVHARRPCCVTTVRYIIFRVTCLKSVQEYHFGSQFAFQHFNFQIEMQIGAQMRTVIPHLKPILDTSKLKIEI